MVVALVGSLLREMERRAQEDGPHMHMLLQSRSALTSCSCVINVSGLCQQEEEGQLDLLGVSILYISES